MWRKYQTLGNKRYVPVLLYFMLYGIYNGYYSIWVVVSVYNKKKDMYTNSSGISHNGLNIEHTRALMDNCRGMNEKVCCGSFMTTACTC